MSTKITKIIKELQHYVDNHSKDVEVDFVMVANDTVCDTDDEDIPINYSGEIGTSLLYTGAEDYPPTVEIGFTFNSKKDWNEKWKLLGRRR